MTSTGQPHSAASPERMEPPALDWLDEGTVARVRAAIAAREPYPDDPARAGEPIAMVQTHISTVFLTAEHVFKFKRPVALGFADFSTLGARERACRAELTLNRRLAEGVYLDVLPLTGEPEAPRLAGEGRTLDWCVVMRRLPADAMLDARLRAGDVTPAELDALAARLAAFHRGAEGGPQVAEFGSPAAVRGNWDENFAQTEPFVGALVEREAFDGLRAAVDGWLNRHGELLAERVRGGFVRDGHGDLRCEHVYLPRGERGKALRIIDCIEFNDRFRYGDVANDLAFLLMDLVALGAPALAQAVMERYRERSGDRALDRLVPFYACYRAYVRFKVTALRSADRNLAPEDAARLRDRAVGFFRLAQRFAGAMEPPVLVLIGGLMGTGKTALAEALAAQSGVAHHASDALRKRLAGQAAAPEARDAAEAPYETGLYSEKWTARTYAELLRRGEAALGAGHSVILDASFARRAHRRDAAAMARRAGARAVFVECRLDERTTRERLRRRQAEGTSLSDGREAIYARQRAAFEPVDDAERAGGMEQVVITTERPPPVLAGELLERLHLPPPLFAGE